MAMKNKKLKSKSPLSELNQREWAMYLPVPIGETKQISVIIADGISNSDLSSKLLVFIPKYACPEIKAGEKFIIQNSKYRIKGEPKTERRNIFWELNLELDQF